MSKWLAVMALAASFVVVGCKAEGEVDTTDAKKMSIDKGGKECAASSCDKSKAAK
jgi:hypothetical protein